MPLREAVKFLKGAVPASRTNPAYSFHGGRCWVRSERAFASYPVEHILGTFALAAADLEGALARMSSEPLVEPGDGTMVLRAGRLRSSIDLLPAEPPAPSDEEGWDGLVPAPPKLLAALERALPFVSDQGTWQRSVLLSPGSLVALSNASAVRVSFPELEVPEPLPLPSDSADYLVGTGVDPSSWRPEEGSIRFEWASGARVRCQLSTETWPGLAERLIALVDADGDAPIAIGNDWREAYADAAALGSGELTVSPTAVVAKSDHAEHRVEFATGVARETKWSIASLKPVFAVATAWGPDAENPAARFVGDGVRGIVARRKG